VSGRWYRTVRQIGDRPVLSVVADVCAELDTLAERDGMRLARHPIWTVYDGRVMCEAPAVPLPETDTQLVRRLGRHRWSVAQIAALTSMPADRVAALLGGDR